MNNLNSFQKVMLINIVIAILITILIIVANSSTFSGGGETALAFGIVCLGSGIINLGIGLILLLAGNKEWRNGFLLSGAALLLLSGISCGGGAAFA
jgi:hypothetical protein